MFTHFIYIKSPIWLQNCFLIVRALVRLKLRDNDESRKLYVKLKTLEFDASALKLYKDERIHLILENAIKNIHFYRSQDHVKIDDLDSFPYISKDNVRSYPEEFKSERKPKLVVNGTTSGTTGSPLSIPQSMESVLREQAFITRSLAWAGYKKGDNRAWIRGDMIVPIEQKTPPFWRYSYFENMILLSSFHMTTEALPLYIKVMVDNGVDIIQAYPSSIVTLAKYLESKNEYYPAPLKSVLTSSESLSPDDKALVEKRFKCTVFDWYGLFERVAAIASCEQGRYHVLTDYSHVEFLDSGDGRHEIVGTNFNNTYYPLIRYKTGDHVVFSDEASCPCGRVYPVVKSIEGRVGDYLMAEDGQKIHILNHIPKGVEGLLACQFIQDASSLIKVLAVVNEDVFSINQEQHLIQNVKDRLGDSMVVKIQRVNALPRTKNGKVRQAVCSIKGA